MKSIFLDKQGKRVIAQPPNIPIILWLIFFVIARVSRGDISDHAQVVSTLALTLWASLEIFSGVNVFRRILGSVVLSSILITQIV